MPWHRGWCHVAGLPHPWHGHCLPWCQAGTLPRKGVARLGKAARHRAPHSFNPWHWQQDANTSSRTPCLPGGCLLPMVLTGGLGALRGGHEVLVVGLVVGVVPVHRGPSSQLGLSDGKLLRHSWHGTGMGHAHTGRCPQNPPCPTASVPTVPWYRWMDGWMDGWAQPAPPALPLAAAEERAHWPCPARCSPAAKRASCSPSLRWQ